MSRVMLATLVILSVGGCSTPAPQQASTAQEMQAFCWFAGGDCSNLPQGDWRSPDFWADVTLAKYASQRQAALDNIEPGPAPLPAPRAVLLITGVTIRAQWFDPIVARLNRDGFRPIVWEPPALLSGSLFQAAQDLDGVVQQALADSGQSQIDILAECTGGVIARHYIQSLGGDRYVSRLVTFVSPQAGLPMARLLSWV